MTRNRCDPRIMKARWWKRPLAMLGASVAAVGVAWAAYDAALRPAPLAELIPEYVPGFVAVDARRAWDLTADLRNTKAARMALAKAEEELHISIKEDILPWAGDVVVAPLSMDPKNQPDLAALVEVRNPVQYYLTMARLRTRLEREATPWWKGTGYRGVPLRWGYVGKGQDRVPVSTAWLKGWLVVGVGNGSAKRVIDAWQGRKRTLATNTAWAGTLAGIPADAPVRLGVNMGMVYRNMQMPGVPREFMDNAQFVFAEALQDTGDGIRFDVAAVPTSPTAHALMQKIARTVPPPSTGLMDRLPDGTFAATAVGNPGAWWDIYVPMFARMTEGRGVSRAEADKVMKPVSEMVHRMKGGVAIGVAQDERNGWGAMVIGDCEDADAARQGAEDLADFVEAHGAKVEVGTNPDTYSLAMPPAPVPGGSVVAPGWNVDGQYLMLASNKAWLAAPAASAPIPLPEEARDAPVLGRGDFSFVPALMKQAAAFGGAKSKDSAARAEKGWKVSRLGDARWMAWSHYRPDGSSTGAFEITNWPWREALRAAVADQ